MTNHPLSPENGKKMTFRHKINEGYRSLGALKNVPSLKGLLGLYPDRG